MEKQLRNAWYVVIWHVITYRMKKQYKFLVYILYLVYILHLVCSLHFAFCTEQIGIAVFV